MTKTDEVVTVKDYRKMPIYGYEHEFFFDGNFMVVSSLTDMRLNILDKRAILIAGYDEETGRFTVHVK